MTENPLLIAVIAVPFAAALAICFARRRGLARILATAAAVSALGLSLLGLFGGPGPLAGLGATGQYFYIDALYPISLVMDGFRGVHLVLISALWLISLVFSEGYFQKTGGGDDRRYYAVTSLSLGGAMGVFLSANLLSLFVFFEIMSFASFLWVIQDRGSRAKKAGNLYLAVSVISGMVMLMGIFMLQNAFGSLELADMARAAGQGDPAVIYTAAALVLVGFGAKAGMYPLHIWLPESYMVSPAPATAMFSAVLSKTGIYGIIVISATVFSADAPWGIALITAALLTMLWGGICALRADNMKLILAYSSMSQLGFIIFGIGMKSVLGGEGALAARGTVLHMLNHSVFKLSLFLLCGIVFMALGTTELSKIKGIGRRRPLFAASFLLCGAGMAGVPLLSGYVSKTLLHESVVEYLHSSSGAAAVAFTAVEWLFLISGGLTAAYLCKLGVCLFSKGPGEKAGVKIPRLSLVCTLLPALGAAAVGIAPALLADPVAALTEGIMQGRAPAHAVDYFSLENLKGAAISLGLGGVIYVLWLYLPLGKKKSTGKLSLENMIYRPLFQKILPGALGAVCTVMDRYVVQLLYKGSMFIVELYARFAAYLVDGIVEVLVFFGFRPAKEKDPEKKRIPAVYRLGTAVDKLSAVRGKIPEKSYAETLSGMEHRSALRRRMIAASLSYGLLFAGLGLIILLIYLSIV